jgi:hypothetical protein
MEEDSGIIWLDVRADGYKRGRYCDPKEPSQTFDVEVAVPGLAAHRFASVMINGAAIGQRSNVQAAMRHAEWVLHHRRRGDFRRRLADKTQAA